MKLKALEMALQRVEPHPDPSAALEQYQTPASVAASVLFQAFGLGDIEGKRVVDLGTGSGILAIGAKLLGASSVTGIDVDAAAIEWAKRQADKAGVKVRFERVEIREFAGSFDTALTNPPFGAQSKYADRPFVEKALETAKVGYSFHLSQTAKFVEKMLQSRGAKITHATNYKLRIPHMFNFHRRAQVEQDVTVVRFERGSEDGWS